MAKKKLDIQAILDNPEQLADLQKKALVKSVAISRSKTLAADPSIMKRLGKKVKATLAANPDILKKRIAKFKATLAADPDIIKKRTAKRLAHLAANPDIIKKQKAKRLATYAANPDIIKKQKAKRLATQAAKQEFHTPYGVFAFKKDAVQAVVGQYGFRQKASTADKIGKLIKTNPKEWYWVKKT